MPNNTGGVKIRPLGAIAQAVTNLSNRFYTRPANTIQGVKPTNWPSALQPVQPIAPDGSQPLAFPYLMGANLTFTPRADAEYSALDLRILSKYPLARICIENTKDQLCRIPHEFQLRPEPGEPNKAHAKRMMGDKNVGVLDKFFRKPDSEHNWGDWLRPLLEDMLVTDTATILARRTFGNKIVGWNVIPGDTIVRYIDDNGFTPQAPAPAYAQLWEGIPRVNLTTEQLVYRPRNIVRRNTQASNLYGFSPTEQMVDEITAGALRLRSVLAYYEKGSVPGIVHVVPPGTPPERIKETMQWMNSELAGQLEKRRQWRMIQGFREDKDDQIVVLKDPILADVFDELHIRKICFGYGTSPQRLMRMMNRASAQTAQESSEEEGLLPWLDWTKNVVDDLLAMMGYEDYEITFQPSVETDLVKQATADKTNVGSARRTLNETREAAGEDPYDHPWASLPLVATPTGYVPLGTLPPAPAGEGPGEPGVSKPKTGGPGSDSQSAPSQAGGTQTGAGKTVPSGPASVEADELNKYSDDQERDERGRWTSSGVVTPITREERARLSHKPATAEKRRLADKSERMVARALGMERTADNAAFDLEDEHTAIEVKTLMDNDNQKITMHPESLRRKQEWAAARGKATFTVVVDRRLTTPKYFIKEGLGSFRIGSMERVGSLRELRDYVR